MDTAKILEIFSYTIPSLITGGVAFLFFKQHMVNEAGKRRFALHREAQKHALPLRLQAYERMSLFLERISPSKLLLRVPPVSPDKNDYEQYIIAHIEQEFEHNLTQQIYISDECWTIITAAKNTTIQQIRNAAKSEKVIDANGLREAILTDSITKESPTITALAFIKSEVSNFL
ncbi:hypothetical protein [Flavobacterium sp. 3HN19-14]|uniref:DUF7935 family protein n=1 Tax=Flavobacterium sp. 3HN19-14 TaxID=3448133 RepID=UPI003EDF2E0E